LANLNFILQEIYVKNELLKLPIWHQQIEKMLIFLDLMVNKNKVKVNASQLTADWRFLFGYLLGFGFTHLGYARSRFIGNR
jgi:hypothetical protein